MEVFGSIVAIAISYFIGPLVGRLLDKATEKIDLIAPSGVSKEDWESFVRPEGREGAGEWLGKLERILAFFSFYCGAYAVIAGWFALKVASKWQVWATIIKMPQTLGEAADNISYLRARQRWGSWLHMRFLIGTVVNVLVGFVLAAILKRLVE